MKRLASIFAVAFALTPAFVWSSTFETLGAVSASSTGTDVTAGDDAKGSYVQFSASITNTWDSVYVLAKASGSSSSTGYLVDIATGSAASESVVIGDLYVDTTNAENYVTFGPFRVDIPSGTRVAARAEATAVSGTEVVNLIIIGATSHPPDLTSPSMETTGQVAGSGSQKGTSIDAGASANTKGSWTQLDAAAPSDCEHFWVMFGRRHNVAFDSDTQWLVDVGIGASSSETVHVADIPLAADQFDDFLTPTVVGPFHADGLQSQRVSVRSQSTTTDATDRLIGAVIIYGKGTPVAGGGGSGGVMPMGGLIKR